MYNSLNSLLIQNLKLMEQCFFLLFKGGIIQIVKGNISDSTMCLHSEGLERGLEMVFSIILNVPMHSHVTEASIVGH